MRVWIPLTIVLIALSACAPTTPIRRSALTPGPSIPSRVGMPLEPREVRVSGEVNPVRLMPHENPLPRTGDPGVFVPRIQVGGSVYGAPIRGLELGAQLRYTHLSWADPSAIGVLPFPDDDEHLLVGGVGLRGNLRFSDDLTGSIMMELNATEIVQAVYVCRTCQPGSINPRYRFERIDRVFYVLPKFAANLSYRFNEHIGVFAFFGWQLGVTNNGFDPDLSNLPNSTIKPMFVVPMGVGFEAKVEMFYVRLATYYPLEFVGGREFGLALSGQVGLSFD